MTSRVQRQPDAGAFLPDARLQRLTRALPTPLYLYDEKSLRANAQALFTSFSWNCGFGQYLPLRRCKNRTLLDLLRQAGCGAMCTDLAQLQLAAACGFRGEALIYAPLVHHEQAEALAFELEAMWAVDGEYVLPPRAPKRVLLRYNPGGRLRAAGQTLANFDRIKYGMRAPELVDMARRFAVQDTESIGLMLSACDNCLDAAYYPAVARALFMLAIQLRDETGIAVDVCNLSGGFGVSSRAEFASPAIDMAAEQIRALHDELLVPAGLERMRLQTALDRYLLTSAGALIAGVTAVRERALPTYFLDAVFEQSMLAGKYHPIAKLGKQTGRELALCCVVGCQDALRGGLGDSCVLPRLRPGDRLVMRMAGMDEIPDGTAVYLLRADGTLERI